MKKKMIKRKTRQFPNMMGVIAKRAKMRIDESVPTIQLGTFLDVEDSIDLLDAKRSLIGLTSSLS